MKRMTCLVMALAMVLGFTQCKKEQTPTNNASEGVFITLNVGGGASAGSAARGSRVIVDPVNNLGTNPDDNSQYATVTFEQGDVIYVGNNGAYCGYLEYDGTNFTGTVNPTSTDDCLHFYFMGNKGEKSQPSTVSITDQTSKYPVISYAHSKHLYDSEVSTYTAKLQNYCAIVKFTTNVPQTAAITVKGMQNTVSVNFGTNNAAAATPTLDNNPYTPGQSGEGAIILHAVSNTERWAILLEQGAVNGATITANGYNDGTCDVPKISNNMYDNSGVSVELTAAPSVPTGALNGLFSVSATQQVYFSQGNLQYNASTDTWQFAANQYDYIGSANSNISSSYSGWVDLFGWGTSGYSHGATCYEPWSTSTNSGDYYAYGNAYNNLTGQADWGYNAISNGVNQENSGWRTLTSEEWGYVFNSRTAASKMGRGNVNRMNGMILLPDDWTLPEGLSFISGDSEWANSYNAEEWAQMEANGAVFLPAAGNRNGTSLNSVGSFGSYWSSSCYNDDHANYVFFSSSMLYPQPHGDRYYGYSVRLVRNTE